MFIATIPWLRDFFIYLCTKDFWFESLLISISWNATFLSQILTESPTYDYFTEIFGRPKQSLQSPSLAFPQLISNLILPHLLFKPQRSFPETPVLCNFRVSAHTIALCGTHCLFLSSPLEPEDSLHLPCFVTCPQVTSNHRNHSFLWNALALTVLVIHLQLIISSCLAILLLLHYLLHCFITLKVFTLSFLNWIETSLKAWTLTCTTIIFRLYIISHIK